MPDLILHHYDVSPFSEKVRLMFGIKGIAWRSVIVPMVLPKPELMPLTGGYRRTPVLQIGADIYCDTSLIARELEARHPSPSLFPPGHDDMGEILSLWAERVLFWPTARYVTGVNSDRLPDAFHADRAAMRGHAPPTGAQLKAAAAHNLVQIRLQIRWLEFLLAEGHRYLLGDAPGLADLAVYQRLWWLGAFGGDLHELEPFPRIRSWMDRLAAYGHGERTEMTAEDALDVARSATPTSLPTLTQPGDEAAPTGARVAVATEDQGPDPVEGTVAYCDADRIVLRREDLHVGTVHVHFPRLGYAITAL